MIRDRGKMKWAGAFFMPEHSKMLKQLKNDYVKQKKPVLDEQELEEIGFIIMDSLNYTLPIQLTVWEEGIFKEHSGIVFKVNLLEKYIIFETDDENLYIFIEFITSVKRI